MAGLDHSDQHDGQVQRPGEGPNANPGFSSAAQGRRRGSRFTGTVTATAMFEVSPALSIRTTAGVHYFKNSVDLFDSAASVFGSLISIRQRGLRAVTSTSGLLLQQQLAWHDRLFLTAGLRRDATTRFHVDDPAAVYPSLGLSWRGPVPSGGFPLSAWRLRAAYGAAGPGGGGRGGPPRGRPRGAGGGGGGRGGGNPPQPTPPLNPFSPSF